MAEVLITLAIIGIVSALTIPNLIFSYKKQLIETRLKDTYSLLNNALKMAEAEHGPFNTWDLSGADAGRDLSGEKLWSYLKPYLKIKDVCERGDIENSWHSNPNKNRRMCTGTVYNIDNSISDNNYGNFDVKKYILMNNVGIFIGGHIEQVITKSYRVSLDMNINSSKMYNGVDFFEGTINANAYAPRFSYTEGMSSSEYYGAATNYACDLIKRNAIMPGQIGTVYEGCKNGETSWDIGHPCAAIIYCNGWKIPDNYPIKF